MKVKRVEHVAIAVKDMQAVMRIFRDKLGLPFEYEEDFPQYQTKIAMFPVGETYLELLEATGRVAPVFVLPEAGHHPMLDQPLILLTALRALLADWDHSEPHRRR